MTLSPAPAGPGARRLRAALALTAAERMSLTRAFFSAHPGGGTGTIGLGRAVADFVDWEVRSGRLADIGGSPWWRAMNGVMALDLREATTLLSGAARRREPSAAVGAWLAYASAGGEDTQAALWDAHQASLGEGVRLAEGLIGEETPEEQVFCRIVLEVVGKTAAHLVATDTDELARVTARSYPACYPITAGQLDALVAGLRRAR